ncbi:MAG: hypothetical protein LBE24_09150 [Methylobacillus sp.]|nr:hypothetical protein [Methylobacillus sp.]
MFLPFYMAPGLAIKGLIPRYFSFSAFVLACTAMEIEPLYRLWTYQAPIHGVSHTLTGALLIAILTALFGRAVLAAFWWLYEKSGAMLEPHSVTWTQVWSGALLGAGSRLLLDAVMYPDVHPFAPFTDANPLLMPTLDLSILLACVLAGMAGMALMLARAAWQQYHAA